MRELPVPAHFDPDRVGEVWRVDYEQRARDAAAWAAEHDIAPAAERLAPRLPARGGRPEHVLHPRLRAVRGRPLRHRRRGRQPPAVRVRLPEPRHDHAGLPEPRHPPRDAGVPRHLAGGRAREPSRAVHAGVARGRRVRALAGERRGGRGARARPRLRRPPPGPLHAGARRRRQVRPHDLAVPRDARRHRPRARLGRGGGALLPLASPGTASPTSR